MRMFQRRNTRLLILLVMAIGAMAQAQFTGNDQTDLIDGVINSWGTSYFVINLLLT